MKRILTCIGVCGLTLSSFVGASAAVVSGDVTSFSGNLANAHFFELDANDFSNSPGKRNNNTFVGNDDFDRPHLYAFNEVQNHVLLNDLSIDGGTILAGSLISSHFVFFDPDADRRQEGWVSFDSDIIGLITTTSLLNSSDAELGASGVSYRTPSQRGLENSTSDTAKVDASDQRMVLVDWKASDPGDYMRVITLGTLTAVPVPAAMPLLLLGLGGLAWIGRRRKAVC